MPPFSSPFDAIFDQNATALDLLVLVLCLAVLWAIAFAAVAVILRPLIYNQPWLIAAGERDYDRGGKQLNEILGAPKTKQQHIEFFMDMWPWSQAVVLQHTVGGLLCVPAVVGGAVVGISSSTAASLACLGILSEMGWELEDILSWIYKRYGAPGGMQRVPAGLVVLLGIHHSLTTTLGIPLVLHYRNTPTLHWLCFNLQFAAATALIVTEYTKLLDVSRPYQLRQFQALTLFALIIMVWTRLFHWVWLCGKFLILWHQEQAWGFLVVGGFLSVAFSGFNWVFCVQPFYARFIKFLKLSVEYEALPVNADQSTRRASLVQLEAAVANVLGRHQLEDELVKVFFAERSMERRSTAPPSAMYGSRTRRSSLALLRASTGDLSYLLSQLESTRSDAVKQD